MAHRGDEWDGRHRAWGWYLPLQCSMHSRSPSGIRTRILAPPRAAPHPLSPLAADPRGPECRRACRCTPNTPPQPPPAPTSCPRRPPACLLPISGMTRAPRYHVALRGKHRPSRLLISPFAGYLWWASSIPRTSKGPPLHQQHKMPSMDGRGLVRPWTGHRGVKTSRPPGPSRMPISPGSLLGLISSSSCLTTIQGQGVVDQHQYRPHPFASSPSYHHHHRPVWRRRRSTPSPAALSPSPWLPFHET